MVFFDDDGQPVWGRLLDRYRIVVQPNTDDTGDVFVQQAYRRWWGGIRWKSAEGWDDITWCSPPGSREFTIDIARRWIAGKMPKPNPPPVARHVVFDTAEGRASGELTLTDKPRPTSLYKPRPPGHSQADHMVEILEDLATKKPPGPPPRPDPPPMPKPRKLRYGL